MPQIKLAFLGFCAVAVILYWLIPAKWRSLFLSACSSVFLAYMDPVSFAVLLALTATVFLSARKEGSERQYYLVLSILLLLFCGIRLAQYLQRTDQQAHWLVLIGFGYYILKLIHYRVERESNVFRAHSFLDFYNYMFFFPTITIGPIHRFEEFLKSDRRIRWNDEMFARGLERILYGYAKVIVVANWLIVTHGMAFAMKLELGPSAQKVLYDSALHGFHLYFTFAGLSDVAIGLGLLFGYRICENFNRPFLKRNIGEFWQSWHMSLSSWCRQYIFLPSYSTFRNLPFALIATMVSIGLWHEFSLRYLLWGVYHGTGLLIWRLYQRKLRPMFPVVENRLWKGLALCASVAVTFSFVMIGFTIPRSSSLSEMIENFQLLAGW